MNVKNLIRIQFIGRNSDSISWKLDRLLGTTEEWTSIQGEGKIRGSWKLYNVRKMRAWLPILLKLNKSMIYYEKWCSWNFRSEQCRLWSSVPEDFTIKSGVKEAHRSPPLCKSTDRWLIVRKIMSKFLDSKWRDIVYLTICLSSAIWQNNVKFCFRIW